MAGCAGAHVMVGPVRRVPAVPRAFEGPDLLLARALSVRTVQYHVEIAVPRAHHDEARDSGPAGSRCAQGRAHYGHGEPHLLAVDRADEHDLRRPLAGR